MRVMAVDFGSKRIGIAVGLQDSKIVTPKSNVSPTGTLSKDAAVLASLGKQYDVEAIVVGIPYNESNDRMARVCQKLADAIQQLGWTVYTVDESLSSLEAENHLMQLDMSAAQRRSYRDREAACVILERYFAQA